MTALENLKTRLEFDGGTRQQSRMAEDKLKSLKKALLYSYQAATAILSDGREFRCLINPDKTKVHYDDKIISIPFKDICLNAERVGKTSQGEVEIGLKAGDVFEWKENQTYWLVYLQRYEEIAYFRAEIRKCDYTVDIDGKPYHVYVRGPEETTITWRKGNYEMYNRENYGVFMYITKDEDTEDYFKRFTKIEIDGKPWEVQTVDRLSTPGIIMVHLKEDFENLLEKEIEKEKQEEKEKEEIKPVVKPYIDGPTIVYPYGEETYAVVGAEEGDWQISNNKAKIITSNAAAVDIEIITGKSGQFVLRYIRENEEDIELPITIESL